MTGDRHQQAVLVRPDAKVPLDSSATKTVFCGMARDGANRAVIVIPLAQAGVQATTITRRVSRGGGAPTPSDSELVGAIRHARQCGLKVVLKPHDEPGEWRAHVTFSNKQNKQADAWAASWRSWMVHYARIAKAEHVDTLVIGTEQFGVTLDKYNRHNTARWLKTIAAVRKADPKLHVTYAAYFGSSTRPKESLLLSRQFVRHLDWIGVTYYPRPGSQTATVAQMRKVMQADLASRFKPMRKRYGKSIVIEEVGLKTSNDRLQADFFEALLSFADRVSYIDGVWLYQLNNTPDVGGPGVFSFTYQGRDAEGVVARWFGGKPVGRMSSPR